MGTAALRALRAAGLDGVQDVRARRGYLLARELTEAQVRSFARAVLCDPVVDQFVVHAPEAAPQQHAAGKHLVTIVPRRAPPAPRM